MEKLLEFLHGKKAIIFGVCMAVLTYLTNENVVTGNLAILIQSVLTLIFGGADVLTTKKFGVHRK